MFDSICVIGLGYIGLPTAVAFATRDREVVGVDVNATTVAAINEGRAPFAEPDLAVALRGAVSMGRLRAQGAPEPCDAFVIAVPTPLDRELKADLSFVRDAATSLAPVLRPGNLVVLESTSPPGTTVELAGELQELRPDLRFPGSAGGVVDVHVAHCPERVLPGRIMIELVTNDRVVGGLSSESGELAAQLYQIFCQGRCAVTDATTAELVKLAENSYRDVNIAFANELSLICDQFGVDAYRMIAMANLHPRVNILRPGPGVGGHCIAVDPWFMVGAAPDKARLIRTAREVNDSKPEYVVDKVRAATATMHAPVVACLGLTFKANVDDIRESPALEVTQRLASGGDWKVVAAEPHLDELPGVLADLGSVKFAPFDEAVRVADVVVVLVAHDEFVKPGPSVLEGKVMLDVCGAWGNE